MNEILDEIELKRNHQKRFSKLSLTTSLINLALLGYMLLGIPNSISASAPPRKPSMLFTFLLHFFVMAGIIMTIMSFTRKEPTTWGKWFGGTLNLIAFLLVEGSVIFAYILINNY